MKARNELLSIGIVGTGNMGTALAGGIARRYAPESISLFDIDADKAHRLAEAGGHRLCESLKILVDNSPIVVLAVKPDRIIPVLEEIHKSIRPDTVLVSIAAGVAIGTMLRITGPSAKIVRAMPNTPALTGEGVTALSGSGRITAEEMERVVSVFQCVGRAIEVPERLMDAVTAVSGSGPAYVFTFIQAMADGGVKMGLPRDKALLLAAQTVLGSAKLVLESSEDPITLRGRVTSPGGTTIDAVHVLERAGFSGIVIDAVESAAVKSKKLGEG
ncbi:MAG: pyrroline-5-carboxylate reductase [Spirochaetes bacterium]|nr:pyrroline-5-carboxylate reductase [Spirochaetota bacterium]